MDKLKRARKDWFYSYNMIFDTAVSGKAKLVYLYLCRCADETGVSFPSYDKIGVKCDIHSRVTISKAIKELVQAGLLTKEQRHRANGGTTSNLYVIHDAPQYSECTPPSTVTVHPQYSECTPPSTVSVHEGLPISKGLLTEGGGNTPTHASAKAPAALKDAPKERTPEQPPRTAYGDNSCVQLTLQEYNQLIAAYGKDIAHSYIDQLDSAMYCGDYANKVGKHYAVIVRWIKRDNRNVKASNGRQTAQPNRVNRFNNFDHRKVDYAEIERLERQRLQADIAADTP